jgi:hypothetical protein
VNSTQRIAIGLCLGCWLAVVACVLISRRIFARSVKSQLTSKPSAGFELDARPRHGRSCEIGWSRMPWIA